MSYYISKVVDCSYQEAIDRVTALLKEQGFGVLTTIDVKETLKKKIGVDFRPYIILGACNPPFAHRALQAEEHLGLLLPCNVVVQERPNGEVEVSAVDPVVQMGFIDNPALQPIAEEVRERLQKVIQSL